MKSTNWKSAIAYVELSLAMIIVGSTVVVGKLIIADFPVFLASELFLLVAVITIVPIQFLIKKGYKITEGAPHYL